MKATWPASSLKSRKQPNRCSNSGEPEEVIYVSGTICTLQKGVIGNRWNAYTLKSLCCQSRFPWLMLACRVSTTPSNNQRLWYAVGLEGYRCTTLQQILHQGYSTQQPYLLLICASYSAWLAPTLFFLPPKHSMAYQQSICDLLPSMAKSRDGNTKKNTISIALSIHYPTSAE